MRLLLLLALAIAVKYLGSRFFPVVMPRGRLFPTLAAFLGAMGGSFFQEFLIPWGLRLWGVYIVGALIGAFLPLFLWGIWPFLQVLFRGARGG